jgi:ATP-dependent Lon protease
MPFSSRLVEGSPFSLLQSGERDYVQTLKRRDRSDLARILEKKSVKREPPLRIQVLQSNLPEAKRLEIFDELSRSSCEKYTTWVRRLIQLPLGVHVQRRGFALEDTVQRAQRIMDRVVTGHESAKREVLKLVCQNHVNDASPVGYALGLEGPPGCGKTHFVKNALAPALNRPFVSIPLGGATDVSFLLGSVFVYEGSRHGRLASALIDAKCSNPIIYFDELDKVSATERGAELANALVHLTDPMSNATLRDRYFHGIDIDFSKCILVFSYNDASKISPILLDRIKRIEVPAPTEKERRAIVRDHILPRTQKRLQTNISLSDAVVELIANRASGGMRNCEKEVDHLIASARLCKSCGMETGEMVGATEKVLEDGCVSHAFAESLLKPKEEDPPPMMYM